MKAGMYFKSDKGSTLNFGYAYKTSLSFVKYIKVEGKSSHGTAELGMSLIKCHLIQLFRI